jgi:hypothetical protein
MRDEGRAFRVDDFRADLARRQLPYKEDYHTTILVLAMEVATSRRQAICT